MYYNLRRQLPLFSFFLSFYLLGSAEKIGQSGNSKPNYFYTGPMICNVIGPKVQPRDACMGVGFSHCNNSNMRKC